MRDMPDIRKVMEIAPEARNLEEIASGGFKIVYKAQVEEETEAVKLVQIPREEHILALSDGLRQFRQRAEL